MSFSPLLPSRVSRWLPLLPVLFLVGWFGYQWIPLINLENDECFYGTVVWETREAGRLFPPIIFGNTFLDKPPLQVILMGWGYDLFGLNRWGLRSAAFLWTLGMYTVLYAAGLELGGWLVGSGACLLLLTLPRFHIDHGVLQGDMEAPLVFSWVVLLWCWLRLWRIEELDDKRIRRLGLLAGCALTIAFMVKATAALLPWVALAPLMLWGDPSRRKRLLCFTVWAMPIPLAVCGSWFLWGILSFGNHFLSEFWKLQYAGRVQYSFDASHVHPASFYIDEIREWWRPWKFVLFPSSIILAGMAFWARSRQAQVLICMTVTPLIPMSLMHSKIQHYLYPLYPLLACIAMIGLLEVARTINRGWSQLPLGKLTKAVPLGTVLALTLFFTRAERAWQGEKKTLRAFATDPYSDMLDLLNEEKAQRGPMVMFSIDRDLLIYTWCRVYCFRPFDFKVWKLQDYKLDELVENPRTVYHVPAALLLALRKFLDEQQRPYCILNWPWIRPVEETYLVGTGSLCEVFEKMRRAYPETVPGPEVGLGTSL